MSSVTWPENGQTLVSSALTPPQIETIFQLLTAQALGFNPPIQLPVFIAGAIPLITAGTENLSPAVTLSSPVPIPVNSTVTGAGIPVGASVAVVSGATVLLSANATATNANVPLLFTPENATPLSAYESVRVAWQQTGQPASVIGQDVCYIRANPENEPFSQVRDSQFSNQSSSSLAENMAFTQVWRIRWTCYGPNCYDRARLIVSAMSLDWTGDALEECNLYPVPRWNRPVYFPELLGGQWWPRADVSLQFNELVIESTPVPAAAGVDVTIKTPTISETISIENQ